MTGKKYYGYQQIFEVAQKRKQVDQVDHSAINDQAPKDQKINQDQSLSQENISSQEKSDNSGWKISRQEDIASLEIISSQENISTQQKNILTGIKTVKGTTSIPNTLLDSLGELLTTAEQLVFIHLYRLSYGFNKPQCLISLDRLGQRTGMSGRNIQNVVKSLERKGLIKKIGHNIGAGKIQGIIFHIENVSRVENNSSLEISSTQENNSSLENSSTNKDHHDDLKKHDHHPNSLNNQTEHEKSVMMIYQRITENNWTKADRTNYEKIKHVPIEKIEIALRAAIERANNRPNSFAYFVKEIMSAANPPKQNRNQRKKALEKIIEQVKNSKAGSSYSISDLAYYVKEACVRDRVSYDTDLFDEIVSK